MVTYFFQACRVAGPISSHCLLIVVKRFPRLMTRHFYQLDIHFCSFRFFLLCKAIGMNRDMDLVRLMLLRAEAGGIDDEAAARYHAECEKYPVPLRAHHIAIMIEAGLIVGFTTNDARGNLAKGVIARLTWQGHEFLDAARNETIWRKARETFFKPAASWTFGLLVEYLKAQAKERLGFGGLGQGPAE